MATIKYDIGDKILLPFEVVSVFKGVNSRVEYTLRPVVGPNYDEYGQRINMLKILEENIPEQGE